jgi:alkanesulfonate monooxygenase SsuD/methylene tetrahydromethanopterin reductase-like flavin-dependent oxidoreductase (luciferase family)
VKAKAQWAETHGFVWFSVMDHMIQISRVGAPDEPVLEGWTVLAAPAAVTSRIRLTTLCTAVGHRNPAHLAKIAATVDLISPGRLTLGIGANTRTPAAYGRGIQQVLTETYGELICDPRSPEPADDKRYLPASSLRSCSFLLSRASNLAISRTWS